MKTKMNLRKLLLPVVAAAAVTAITLAYQPVASEAAKAKSTTFKNKIKKSKTKGADPNIKKSRSAMISAAKSEKAPPSKGGPKVKASWGSITFDNYTNEYVDCYVDGEYQGTTGPFDDYTVSVTPRDNYRLYAACRSGTWGPRDAYLGNVDWQLDD